MGTFLYIISQWLSVQLINFLWIDFITNGNKTRNKSYLELETKANKLKQNVSYLLCNKINESGNFLLSLSKIIT